MSQAKQQVHNVKIRTLHKVIGGAADFTKDDGTKTGDLEPGEEVLTSDETAKYLLNLEYPAAELVVEHDIAA